MFVGQLKAKPGFKFNKRNPHHIRMNQRQNQIATFKPKGAAKEGRMLRIYDESSYIVPFNLIFKLNIISFFRFYSNSHNSFILSIVTYFLLIEKYILSYLFRRRKFCFL